RLIAELADDLPAGARRVLTQCAELILDGLVDGADAAIKCDAAWSGLLLTQTLCGDLDGSVVTVEAIHVAKRVVAGVANDDVIDDGNPEELSGCHEPGS